MSKHYCHQTPGLHCSLEGPGNTCTGGWLSAGHCANRKDYSPAAKSEQLKQTHCAFCSNNKICKYRDQMEELANNSPLVINCKYYKGIFNN